MVSLADLFDSLGGNSEDLDFRKGKEFVDKLVVCTKLAFIIFFIYLYLA